jgi:hypothetical protein
MLTAHFWRVEAMNWKLAHASGGAIAILAALEIAALSRAQAAEVVHVRGAIVSLGPR